MRFSLAITGLLASTATAAVAVADLAADIDADVDMLVTRNGYGNPAGGDGDVKNKANGLVGTNGDVKTKTSSLVGAKGDAKTKTTSLVEAKGDIKTKASSLVGANGGVKTKANGLVGAGADAKAKVSSLVGLGKCNFYCVSYCTKGCKNYIDVDAEVGAHLEGLVGLCILPNIILVVNSAKSVATVAVDGLLCLVGGLLGSLIRIFNCNC